MSRPFVSLILSYPKAIQTEIDKLIKDKNAGPKPILDFLSLNIAQLPKNRLPCKEVINHYIKHLKYPNEEKLATVDPEEGIRNEETSLQTVIGKVEVMQSYEMELLQNNKLHLDSMLMFITKRINIIERYQQTSNFNVKWESMMKGYIDVKVKIIEMKAKLAGELSDDRSIIINTLQVELPRIYRAFADSVKEVCPEKLSLIMEKLVAKSGIEWEDKLNG